MTGEQRGRVASYGLGFLRIERGDNGSREFVLVAGGNASAGRDELAGEWLEVFHVRAENHGFFRKNGLARVLSAGGSKAFPDDDHVGMGGPIAKFAGGVDDEYTAVVTNRRGP